MSSPADDLPSAADLRASQTEELLLDLSDPQPPSPMKPAPGTSSSGAGTPQRTESPARSAVSSPARGTPEQPAPKAAAASGWGGFASSWGGWVDAVKKQSEAVVDVYKRDISEFVAVVASESSSQMDKITHSIKDSITEITSPSDDSARGEGGEDAATPVRLSTGVSLGDMSISTATPEGDDGPEEHGGNIVAKLDEMADRADEFLLSIGSGLSSFLSNAVTIIPGLDGSTTSPTKPIKEPITKRNIIFNRKTALITSLRTDDTTYADPGSDDQQLAARFNEFRADFSLQDKQSQNEILLLETPEMRTVMDRLVPKDISYADFWTRYYFRVTELEREEETRKKLMSAASASNSDQEDFSWGSEDEETQEEEPMEVPKDSTPSIPEQNTAEEPAMSATTPETVAVTAAEKPPISPISAVKAPSRTASPSSPSTPPPGSAPSKPVTSEAVVTSTLEPETSSEQSAASVVSRALPIPLSVRTPSSSDSFEVVSNAPGSNRTSPVEDAVSRTSGSKKGGENGEEEEEGWGEWE
ncbi:hypothetical protein HKX48_009011 [Thoreauomyces humboldtii]|nr:hypothetical protein HKX48_009011 [Thoreauomyces humboldtii]